MATSTPEAPQVTPPKSRKRLVLIVLAALVLTAAAAGGAYYYFYAMGDHKPKVKVELPVDPIFIALEPFTVNLQPGGRSRFLHVGMTLKVGDAKSQTLFTQYLPEVRSRVLTVLSNRQAETLLTPEEKALLAAEIMTALNLPFGPNLPSSKISSVMFTTFMLQ